MVKRLFILNTLIVLIVGAHIAVVWFGFERVRLFSKKKYLINRKRSSNDQTDKVSVASACAVCSFSSCSCDQPTWNPQGNSHHIADRKKPSCKDSLTPKSIPKFTTMPFKANSSYSYQRGYKQDEPEKKQKKKWKLQKIAEKAMEAILIATISFAFAEVSLTMLILLL